jgi:hypothetical protein
MSGLLIGYTRAATEEQDLAAQRDGLAALGVEPSRIYVDHGLTGTNRERPGLREALAACRAGDTMVVTKLDRLARSLPDARAIAEDLTKRQARLSLGASVYDPTDPVGRLLFNVLAMVAEFEADLIRSRTREGMRVAKAKGHLRGKQPKLTPAKRRTWSNCCTAASTVPPNSATCSVWPARPSTAPSHAARRARPPVELPPPHRNRMPERGRFSTALRSARRTARTVHDTARPAIFRPRIDQRARSQHPKVTPHTGR